MSKFNEYTEKTTPDDNDITLILDSTANANKKTPFSGIWSWIKGKIGDEDLIPIYANAGSHNSIYRGKNLGTSFTSAMSSAIQGLS